MTDHVAELEEFGRRRAAAEVGGDVDVLDSMGTKDFILVGPLGFLLDKTQWLDRYRCGDFVTSALDRLDTQVRVFGDCAIVVGVHDQEASYRGQANDGQFRATHILVRAGDSWRLAGIHMSPITARRPLQEGEDGGHLATQVDAVRQRHALRPGRRGDVGTWLSWPAA